MSQLSPEQDPKVWDGLAQAYAENIAPVTTQAVDHALAMAAIEPGERVLEVACGAGALSLAAAATGAKVLATDFAPTFVAMVQEQAEREGHDGLEARVMDGQALQLDDESFDAGFSLFGIFLFPRRDLGFQELYRVLRPGGRAVVTSFQGPPRNEWMALFGQAVQRAFPDMPTPPPPQALEVADPESLAAELQDAGFGQVDVEVGEQVARWPDADVAWRALTEAAPIFQAISDRVGTEGVARLRSVFDEMAQERFGPGEPVELHMPVNFALARKG